MKPILLFAGALLAGAASAALTTLFLSPGAAPTSAGVSAREAVGPASDPAVARRPGIVPQYECSSAG